MSTTKTQIQPSKPDRRERLEARITPELKTLLYRAAALEGRSVTDFVIASVQQAATEAIHRHEVMTLSAADSARFVEAILNPEPPNDALRDAARSYRELIGE